MLVPGYDVIAAIALILCIVLLAALASELNRRERAERTAESRRLGMLSWQDCARTWRERATKAESEIIAMRHPPRGAGGRFARRAPASDDHSSRALDGGL